MGIQTIMNGRPRGPQVEKIVARVRAMAEGELLTHDELQALVGETARSSRYRSVVAAAKRRCLDELGAALVAEMGTGYRKAKGYDQLRHGVGTVRRGVRAIGRGVKVAAVVADDRLPDARLRDARDHIVRQATMLRLAAQQAGRELALAVGTPERIPRPVLPTPAPH